MAFVKVDTGRAMRIGRCAGDWVLSLKLAVQWCIQRWLSALFGLGRWRGRSQAMAGGGGAGAPGAPPAEPSGCAAVRQGAGAPGYCRGGALAQRGDFGDVMASGRRAPGVPERAAARWGTGARDGASVGRPAI